MRQNVGSSTLWRLRSGIGSPAIPDGASILKYIFAKKGVRLAVLNEPALRSKIPSEELIDGTISFIARYESEIRLWMRDIIICCANCHRRIHHQGGVKAHRDGDSGPWRKIHFALTGETIDLWDHIDA